MIKNVIKYIFPLIIIPITIGVGLYYYTIIPMSTYDNIDDSIEEYKKLHYDNSKSLEEESDFNTDESHTNSPFTNKDDPDGYIQTVDPNILLDDDVQNHLLSSEEFKIFKNELENTYENFNINKMNWSELIKYGNGIWSDINGNRVVLQGESVSINDVIKTIKKTDFNGRVIRIELDNGINIDLDIIDHRMMIINNNIKLNPTTDQTLSGPYGVFVDKKGNVLTLDVSEAHINNRLVSQYVGYSNIEGGGFYQVYNEKNKVIVYPAIYNSENKYIVTKDGVFTQIY